MPVILFKGIAPGEISVKVLKDFTSSVLIRAAYNSETLGKKTRFLKNIGLVKEILAYPSSRKLCSHKKL